LIGDSLPGKVVVSDRVLSERIVDWQLVHGRHDLPWQNTTDAYRIWVSEIMLQQTQVATVLSYYENFLLKFPTVKVLAASPIDDVLALWSGLGYYSRARNMHRCAQQVAALHAGQFPQSQALLITLPGIGRSTAAAITAFAYGTSAAILDGNVKRVFCRYFGVDGYPGKSSIDAQLWIIAEREKPKGSVEAYTQGLMDLGASLCSRNKPKCAACPLADLCVANKEGRQAELPTRKPKKVVPTKLATFLLIRSRHKVLLERRAPVGIWGGLWCLPQVDDEPSVASNSFVKAQGFEHTFTHFKMQASVFRETLAGEKSEAVSANIAEGTQAFFTLEEAFQLGLPSPIRAYLVQLAG
jgi:A/G-specific adenine glycosylase